MGKSVVNHLKMEGEPLIAQWEAAVIDVLQRWLNYIFMVMSCFQELFVNLGFLVPTKVGYLIDLSSFWKVILILAWKEGPLRSESLESNVGSRHTCGVIISFDYTYFCMKGVTSTG